MFETQTKSSEKEKKIYSCPIHGRENVCSHSDGYERCRTCKTISSRKSYFRNVEKNREKIRERYHALSAEEKRDLGKRKRAQLCPLKKRERFIAKKDYINEKRRLRYRVSGQKIRSSNMKDYERLAPHILRRYVRGTWGDDLQKNKDILELKKVLVIMKRKIRSKENGNQNSR